MRAFLQIIGVAAVAFSAAGAILPIPAEPALEQARAGVEELTKSDYALLERGKMTHAQLAQNLQDYAAKAEDPASVYLLRRAAFRQYLQGGDIPAAEKLYDRFTRVGGQVYAQEIARFSVRMLSRQVSSKTAGAKEFMDRLTVVDKKVRNAEAARMIAEKTPTDLAATERYAASLVAIDDWQNALVQFTRLGARERELALFERRYPRTGVTRLTTADVADRWWGYPESATIPADEAAAFRVRAAKWYRLAITNGVLRGVKRQIAEKRIQETEVAK